MRVKKLTEKAFMQQVISLARLHSWLVYHTHNSRRSEAGFPDLLLLRGPKLLVLELKVGNNQPTPVQALWQGAFLDAGIQALICWPRDWPLIERTLSEKKQ